MVRREVGSAVIDPTRERHSVHSHSAVRGRTDSTSAVRINGLTKRFHDTVAVDELSLTVEAGEVFGFLGPNGAGKSTTIRVLLGLLRPSAGGAEIFGIPAGDVRQVHRHLAYVPADVALWPTLTGAEILELLGNVGPGVDAEYRAELVDRFDLDLNRPGKAYSTGNRQKVSIVAAFATRAPLLVLDEPTSGLDPLMEREFRNCVVAAREQGQTCSSARTSCRRSKRFVTGSESCGPVDWSRSTASPICVGSAAPLSMSIRRRKAVAGQHRWAIEPRASRRSTSALQPIRTTGSGTAGAGGGRCDLARDARTDTRGDFPRLLRRGAESAAVTSRQCEGPRKAPDAPSAGWPYSRYAVAC